MSSDQAAVATADGRLLAVPCANDVRIYSIATVDVVGVLRGHTQKVTAVCGDPKNPGQVRRAAIDTHRFVFLSNVCSDGGNSL